MLKNLIKHLPLLCGLLLSLLTVGSLLGQYHWGLDVLSHFNIQYTVGLLVCFVADLIVRRRWLTSALLLPALLANLLILAPFFLPPAPAVAATDSTLRVATVNIHTRNENYEAVANYLRETQADVVMVTEAEPALMAALNESVGELYPYIHDDSMRGTLGLALLSRQPFTTVETVPLNHGRRRRLIHAEIIWQSASVAIYGIHPYPPLGSRLATSRNTELHLIQTLLADKPGPLILLGDFNAAPWAYPMRQLTAAANLRHAAIGFGIHPTWYFRLLSAPLDHVLVSPEWAVLSYQTTGNIGSDHVPVVADLVLHN